jgi:hypothetical protein
LQSNLVRALLKQYEAFQLPILIVNDRSKNCPFKRVQWHELNQIRSCALIVEGECVCVCVCVCCVRTVHYNVRTFLLFPRCHDCIFETIQISTHYFTLRLKLLLRTFACCRRRRRLKWVSLTLMDTFFYRILQELLNFQCHHQKVSPIFVISHSLHREVLLLVCVCVCVCVRTTTYIFSCRQNISGLLCFFQTCVISAYKANVRSLRQLLTYYCFTKEESEAYVKQLLDWEKPYSHLFFHVESREFHMQTFPYIPPVDQREPNGHKKTVVYQGRAMTKKDAVAYERAKRFLGNPDLVKSPEKSLAIFDLVYPRLLKSSFDVETLTVTLNKFDTGRKRKAADDYAHNPKPTKIQCSVIEYIACLTEADKEPSPLIAQFHAYIVNSRNIILPTAYLDNKRFH